MVIRYLVGLILVVLALITGILFGGGGILIYMDVSSTFILVFGSFFAILMFYTPKEIKTAFVHAFAKEADKTTNYELDIILFESLHKILTIMGIIGLLTGIIALFSYIKDYSMMGVGFSQAVLVNLYALVLQLILTIPCKAMLKKKQRMQ